MSVPNSDRSSQTHRTFRSMCLLLVLACLLAVTPAAAAPPASPAQDNPAAPGVPPLAEYLNPDGTLALPAGQAIGLDPRGYQLVSGPGEALRFSPASLEAVPGDENWAGGLFGWPGTNDYVDTVAVDAAGNLYAGGKFTAAGGVNASYIGKWDGTSWSALGGGMNNRVYALALDAAGNLYAGGTFTTAGGVSASYIAKWDGAAWSALGSGMSGGGEHDPRVNALVVDGAGNLYAGGWFATAGGVSANRIAKWDGTAWSALGSGVDECANYWDCVRALALDAAGNLYAGGSFYSAGGVITNYIAKWDGVAWSALGSGVDWWVSALTVDAAGNLYAGGWFTTAGGVSANYIAKWDGTAWSALGSGMNDGVLALAVDAAGNLYAGGQFPSVGGVGGNVNHIAKWDGTAWSALGSGVNLSVYALALDAAGNLYAGGVFYIAGGVSANNIAQWYGALWSALGNGIIDGVYALAADAVDNLYAGGGFAVGGVSAKYIAKWNGTAWSALGSGMDDYVRALALDAAGNLYAGGDFTTAGGVSANYIAKWDGTVWSALGSGMNGYVYALTVDGAGNLYAGGGFTTAGGVGASRIAKWDGTTWSTLGTGMNDGVFALAANAAGNLYAGGYFDTAGMVIVNGIAKWDGTAWSALGNGVDGCANNWHCVRALVLDAAGNLYAGGGFTEASGVGVNRIAKWDGTAWSALGSGMSGSEYPTVAALAADAAGNLYAGGGFTTAGNHVSARLARWTAADGAHNVTTGNYLFYTNNLPVTIDVVTPGTLDHLALQRFNRSHPQATPNLATGYYWEIAGTDASGNPATGYVVDLTLPTTFTAGADDRVCRYTGSTWDCAASAFTANSISRTGITQLSDWAVQNNVTCADFDGDGTIDIDDLIAITTRWGQTSGTPGWDGRFDLRPDGRIDIVDIQLAGAHWGQSCSL